MQLKSLALAVAALTALGCSTTETLYEYEGKPQPQDSLPGKYRLELYDLEVKAYIQKLKLIEDAAIDEYLASEAKRSGKTAEVLRRELLEAAEPTEAELKAFYEENKLKIPYPYDLVKYELTEAVKEDKTTKKRSDLLQRIKSEKGFRIQLAYPERPILEFPVAGYPYRGNPEAKITVVEFADFKCPYCAQASHALDKVYAEMKDKIKFVFADYAVLSPASTRIAIGAYCAREQDKYWEYNRIAFDNQFESHSDSPKEFASQIGLDVARFEKCLADPDAKKFVVESVERGRSLGVKKTPTFLVNGKVLELGTKYEDMARMLRAEIARAE